jgi:hypothetical protein
MTQEPWNKSAYERWSEEEGIPVIGGFYIEDIQAADLKPWQRLGGKGAFLNLEGTGQVNDAYICEIPPGKTLHPERHLFEELIYVVKGRGATTIWTDGGNEADLRVAGGESLVPASQYVASTLQRTGREPARYLALRPWGSRKHRNGGKKYRGTVDLKQGGDQIEYRDEDPSIRKMFSEELAKSGLESGMARYFEAKA